MNKDLARETFELVKPFLIKEPATPTELIEEQNGVSFAQKPTYVGLWETWNEFLLKSKTPPGMYDYWQTQFHLGASAAFIPNYTLVLLKNKPDFSRLEKGFFTEVEHTALHEAWHGYAYTRQPHFTEKIGKWRSSQYDMLRNSLRPSNTNLEPGFVLNCFNEGLAEWGAVDTMLRKILLDKADLGLLTRIQMTWDSGIEKREMGFHEQEQTSEIQQIYQQKVYRSREKAIILSSEERFRQFWVDKGAFQPSLPKVEIQKAWQEYAKLNYDMQVLGRSFVLESINYLLSSGFAVGHGVNSLIDYPPQTLEDLSNPTGYAIKVRSLAGPN